MLSTLEKVNGLQGISAVVFMGNDLYRINNRSFRSFVSSAFLTSIFEKVRLQVVEPEGDLNL
jgi:hypothetical protein